MNKKSLLTPVGLSMLLIFQNCSGTGVRLTLQKDVLPSQTPPTSFTATFCPSLSPQGTAAKFVVTRIHVINLTTAFWQGLLKADSDMDGIGDVQETSFSFQPLNPRSNGLLDSVCLRLGGPGICQAPPTCSGLFLAPGLTDCDMGDFQSPTAGGIQGFDSDQDGIPDLIELVRGTDPVSEDDDLDYDSDGISNLTEILRGTDPKHSDNVPPRQQILIRRTDTTQNCGSGEELVHLELMSFPLVNVEATMTPVFSSGGKTIDLSHASNENVIAVYYISEPELNANLRSEMYVGIFKVKTDGTSSKSVLTDSDFIFLGEIRQ